MMAGESVDVGEDAFGGGGAVGDSTATAAGDCDGDSVLELECCCCGSDLVSDILRAAVSRGVLFWFIRLCCQALCCWAADAASKVTCAISFSCQRPSFFFFLLVTSTDLLRFELDQLLIFFINREALI